MTPGSFVALETAALALMAGAYAALAWGLRSRRVDGDLSFGHAAFRAWWGAMALAFFALAAFLGLSHMGRLDLATQLALLEVFIVACSAAGGALVMHLLFVVTGRGAVLHWVWPFAAIQAFVYTRVLFLLDIEAIYVEGGRLAFDSKLMSGDGTATLLIAGFFAPHLVAALGYAAFALMGGSPTAKYRALLVAASVLLVGFSASFIMLADEIGRTDLQYGMLVLALLGPLTSLLAYVPPAWLQRRFGVASIAAFSSGTGGRRRQP